MGRNPGYDPNGVLRKVSELFRCRPIHSVSIQEIVSTCGINRFAIYEKFGGKDGLLHGCLEYYLEVAIRDDLLAAFKGETATFDDLLALLHGMRQRNSDPDQPAGCLIMNASIEMDGADERVEEVARRYQALLTRAASIALTALQESGEASTLRPVPERAEYVVTVLTAFMVLARVSRALAGKLIGVLISEVSAWRTRSEPLGMDSL